MKKLILVPLLLFTLLGVSQNTDSLMLVRMFSRAEQHFMNARKDSVLLVLDTLAKKSKALANYQFYTQTLLAQTNVYNQLQQFDKAQEAATELDKVSHQFLKAEDPAFLDIYNSLIVLAHERLEFKRRDFYLDKVNDWFAIHGKSGEYLGSYIYILSNLSAFSLDEGDFYKSKDYNQQVLNLITDSLSNVQYYTRVKREAFKNIGSAHVGLREYKQAIKYFEQSRNVHIEKKLQDNNYLNLLDQRAASALLNSGNSDEAIKLSRRVLANMDAYQSIQQKEFDESAVYQTLGQAYSEKNDYQASESSFKKAISLRKNYYEKYFKFYKNTEIGSSIFRLGEMYRRQDRKSLALACFQKSLIHYSIFFNDSLPENNPHLSNLKITAFYLVEILRNKAELQFELAQQNQDIETLETSLATYQLLINLIDRDRQRYKAERSKAFLLSQAVTSFEGAISVAMELYKITQNRIYAEIAFGFNEKSKAVLLYSSLKNSEAKYIANVPDTILLREEELNNNLNLFKEKIYQESNSLTPNDSLLKELRSEVFQDQQQLDELNLKLEKEFPEYFEVKNATGNISISEIQDILKREDRQLVEFFAGTDRFFVFNIQAENFFFYELKRSTEFEDRLKSLLETLQGIKEFDSHTFENDSKELYEYLLGKSGLTLGASHLTIIPDGLLGYLPFEVLINDQEKKKYLIESFSISYAYSAKISFKNPASRDLDKVSEKAWRGYAPEYVGDQYLEFNKDEIREVSRFFSGDTLIGSTASIDDYLTYGPDQSILHLAMHAYMDLENPLYSYLAFSPLNKGDEVQKLYASKIMNQKLHADLVVLSACNTGYGPLAKGEGIMSLARAFRLAGCSSILMNLWNSDGSVSLTLMKNFYVNLNEGMSKDEALRKAKLKYLVDATPNRRSPIYWSNLVLIGDNSPLDQNNKSQYLIGLLFIFFLLILFYKKIKI